MTNGNQPNEGAMLETQVVPGHRDGFWADLDLALIESESQPAGSQPVEPEPTASLPAASPRVEYSETKELPVAAATQPHAGIDELAARRNGRRIWPMAAAAAVLAMMGIGFLATRSPADPTLTTDLVAGTVEAADTVPLDGPTDEDQDAETDTGDDAETAGSDPDPDTADADVADADTESSGAAADPTPAAAPLLAFELATGSTGEPAFFPSDGGLPSGSEFLANSAQLALTWWSVSDGDCADGGSTRIRYVNGSGKTQNVQEPDLVLGGDVSYFTVGGTRAAWLVSCGSQLELWVGSLLPDGQFSEAKLVWFGPAQPENALLLWVADEVNLNVLGTEGSPFSIEYEAADETVTRNGRPTRFELESGVIDHRTFPAAVSSDGDISYWPGISDQGEGACAGSFGRADTLWLRRLTADAIPVWEPALADNTRIGAVTAMAVESEFSQVAFADVCPDEVGRVFIATQRADGQLSNLREIDLSPYVPGYADALYWIDSQTLRIETDNSPFGVDPVRFDYRLDDGRENGVIVQLD